MTNRIVITPGEPAGIGPDLTAILAQHPPADTELVVVGDQMYIHLLLSEEVKVTNVMVIDL